MLLARATRLLADCGIHIGSERPPRHALVVSLASRDGEDALGRRQEMALIQRGLGPVALVLMGLFLLPMATCDDGSTGQAAARYEEDGFSIQVPAGWRNEQRTGEGADRGVLFLSPEPVVANRLGLPNEIFVFLPERAYESVENYVDDQYDFDDIVVTERRKVEVPGATEALRIETEGTTTSPEVTIRQVFLIARRSDDSVVDVVCRGAVEDFQREVCKSSLSSLRILSK